MMFTRAELTSTLGGPGQILVGDYADKVLLIHRAGTYVLSGPPSQGIVRAAGISSLVMASLKFINRPSVACVTGSVSKSEDRNRGRFGAFEVTICDFKLASTSLFVSEPGNPISLHHLTAGYDSFALRRPGAEVLLAADVCEVAAAWAERG